MYDYGLSTLEQYDLTAQTTSRIRGALLCHTEKGLFILKEYHGSEKKLQKQQELLLKIRESGYFADTFVENNEGSLVSCDRDNIPYTLQRWYEGRECDTRSGEDIIKSVRMLAGLHKVMHLPLLEDYMGRPLKEEFVRHNQEMRKIRKFIRKKGPSGEFEDDFLESVEWFLKKGETALAMLEDSDYESLRGEAAAEGAVCHGEYNQHNVLMTRQGTVATNFRHWSFDIQMMDLYRFIRKILEKYQWDMALAMEMLRIYHREKGISPEEWELLGICFSYPDKYWKLANYYYSRNKVRVSEKNTEKLKALIAQKNIWERFSGECFSRYPF